MFVEIGIRRQAAAILALAFSSLIALTTSTVALAGGSPIKLSITPEAVSGGYFELTMAPGESRELAVLLGNHGDAPIKVRTYAADAYSIVNGGFGARLSGEPASGATTWVQYSTEVLSIEPGTGIRRPFTVTLPADATPGEHITSLIVQNEDAVSTGTGVVIRQVVRQAVAIAITVPGPLVPGLRVGAARHSEVAGRSVLAVELENTGNVRLRPTAEVTVTDSSGKVVSAAQIPMDSIYAGRATLLELPLAARLLEGDYRIAVAFSDAERDLRIEPVILPVVVTPPPAVEPAAIGAVRELTAVAQQLAGTVSAGAVLDMIQFGVVAVALVASLIATAGMLIEAALRRRSSPAPTRRATVVRRGTVSIARLRS